MCWGSISQWPGHYVTLQIAEKVELKQPYRSLHLCPNAISISSAVLTGLTSVTDTQTAGRQTDRQTDNATYKYLWQSSRLPLCKAARSTCDAA